MISEATVMAKPDVRLSCSPAFVRSAGPMPTSTVRRKRSLVSVTRFHVMVDGSMSRRQKAAFSSSLIYKDDGDREHKF